jgi:hypothetical protein
MTAELVKAMTEDELLHAVTEAATWYGWKWFHVRRSDKALQMGHAGWPDLFLVKDGKAFALELKRDGKKATPDQFSWLAALDHVPGVSAYTIHPKDLDMVLEWLAR